MALEALRRLDSYHKKPEIIQIDDDEKSDVKNGIGKKRQSLSERAENLKKLREMEDFIANLKRSK